MTRTCSDCTTPICERSKGRCRSCARVAANRTPAMRSAAREAMRRLNQSPQQRLLQVAARALTPDWCPHGYSGLNRKMIAEGFDESERQRIIADDMAVRCRRSGAIA